MAWQIGDTEILVPDISWNTLKDLLDPNKPVAEREVKIQTMMGGGIGEPPFGGYDGPIIIFPEDPDQIPGGEGEEAYGKGKYFRPGYDPGEWQLDWPRLAILLGQQLPEPVYSDGNPELAKENLDAQVPAEVNNLGVVVDEASLNDEQRGFARQIPEAIKNAGVDPDTVEVSFSLEEFPTAPNILFITAENDEQLVERLTQLGEDGHLTDKYIFLYTCGDEGLREFSEWVVEAYGLTGLTVYRDKIHPNTLPIIAGEMYRLAREEPGLAPAELIDQAIQRALEGAVEGAVRQNLDRLRNGWNQLSRQLDLHGDGDLVAQT